MVSETATSSDSKWITLEPSPLEEKQPMKMLRISTAKKFLKQTHASKQSLRRSLRFTPSNHTTRNITPCLLFLPSRWQSSTTRCSRSSILNLLLVLYSRTHPMMILKKVNNSLGTCWKNSSRSTISNSERTTIRTIMLDTLPI